jgi:hypothetical protein
MMQRSRLVARVVAVTAFGLIAAVASGAVAAAEQASADAASPSLRQLRADVRKAERRFQSLYNQLNQDSEQQVSCDASAPTGTRFAKRKCTTRAAESARGEAVGEYIDTGELNNAVGVQTDGKVEHAGPIDRVPVQDRYTAQLSGTDLHAQQEAFAKNLEKLMAANPELRKRFEEYRMAQQRLKAAEGADKPAQ